MFKVLVCGGRNFHNYDLVEEVLGSIHIEEEITLIISGHARGADSLGERWAFEHSIFCEFFPAKWDLYGKGAGHIRNRKMLEEGKPDLVVAFPGGNGTKNMMDISRKAGVEVIDVQSYILNELSNEHSFE